MTAIPAHASRPSAYTITAGLDLLDQFTAHATQAQKNTIHEALFAIADHTAYTRYPVIDDPASHMELFILTASDLTLKIRIDDFNAFAIRYIGPATTAPGLTPTWASAL